MIGLRAEGSDGVRLLARGFFQVHDALAFGQYFSESWSLISSELPRSPMWKEWDRCEKPRRAVRNRLMHHAENNPILEAAIGAEHREIARTIFDDKSEECEFID